MKILAATPVQYSRTRYIVELTSEELNALTTFHRMSGFTVTAADGKIVKRDLDKLESGDEIPPEAAAETIAQVREMLDNRKQINSGFASLKAAMTKVHNAMLEAPKE